MAPGTLFDAGTSGSQEPDRERALPEGAARLMHAVRHQRQFETYSLDERVPEDHRVRKFARALKRVDLTKFSDHLRARGTNAGRSAIDPEILVLLWLFATSESVSSARELERRCERDDVYRWILGGVTVNHHTLSDFRTCHGDALDALMTQLLAVFMREGLLDLRRVAQDGIKVRAASGAASFHRRPSLTRAMEEARSHVQQMRKETEEGTTGRNAREQAAARRAAQEAEARVMAALDQLNAVNNASRTSKNEPRASSTDPQARVMKMPDGGFRPAYNVQIASDTKSRLIVDLEVIQKGNDFGEAPPRMEAIERRLGRRPQELLVDGGFAALATIDALEEKGITVYAPVIERKNARVAKGEPRATDSPHVARWRQRMDTPEAQAIYRERAAVAETVNADLRRWRGMSFFHVRGLKKVRCAAYWSAITYNLLRWITLGGAK